MFTWWPFVANPLFPMHSKTSVNGNVDWDFYSQAPFIVHCFCVVLNWSAWITISALLYCVNFNLRCSVLHWVAVEKIKLPVTHSCIAVKYEWSFRKVYGIQFKNKAFTELLKYWQIFIWHFKLLQTIISQQSCQIWGELTWNRGMNSHLWCNRSWVQILVGEKVARIFTWKKKCLKLIEMAPAGQRHWSNPHNRYEPYRE